MSGKTPFPSLSVLVTRPAHQADPFCQMLEQAGVKVLRFPSIEIVGTNNPKNPLQNLQQCDLVIFTSHNAVKYALPWFEQLFDAARTKVAAIGKQTATSLQARHIAVDCQPDDGFNSEALLALPDMQNLAGQRIIIVKGEGGRSLLADTLRQRGAEVEGAIVYRRRLPSPSAQQLADLRNEKVDIITLTSTESSDNLFTLLADKNMAWLHQATLLLGSPRIAERIKQKNDNNPLWVADNPTDQAMYDALLAWKEHHIERI